MRQMTPNRLAEGQDARRQRKGWAALGASLLRFVRYQGQIGDCGGHQQLVQSLPTPEIACLPNPQLHQAPKPVFCEMGTAETCFHFPDMKRAYNHLRKIYRAAGAADRLACETFPTDHRWCGNKAWAWMERWL